MDFSFLGFGSRRRLNRVLRSDSPLFKPVEQGHYEPTPQGADLKDILDHESRIEILEVHVAALLKVPVISGTKPKKASKKK